MSKKSIATSETSSTGAELVSDVAMDILMNRLPENEFVELCSTL